MMTTLTWILSAAVWMQEPAPKDPPPPPPAPRVERPVPPGERPRDPFERPREAQDPAPQPPRDGNERRAPRPLLTPHIDRIYVRDPIVNPEEVLAWLKENEPATMGRLMKLEEEGRNEDAKRLLAEAGMRVRELKELKQRDPKGYEKMMELRRLELESMTLADQARLAPPEEREAAQKKLRETLSRLFDLREESRVRELAELKRRVEGLEKALAERKTNKDRIVEKRRRELLGEKSEDDW